MIGDMAENEMPYSNYYAGGNGIPYMTGMGSMGEVTSIRLAVPMGVVTDTIRLRSSRRSDVWNGGIRDGQSIWLSVRHVVEQPLHVQRTCKCHLNISPNLCQIVII